MTFLYGSVCSGIEAATVAWEVLGARAAWFAEIDPFAAKVLAHHYPNVPNLGDMTHIAQCVRLGLVAAPDVLVGGTPCQAFSVAGLRAGLADPRGQLTLSYVDLANAIDEQRPGNECTTVWENVPGVLSDKSNAFGCFLGYLAGEDDALVPPGKSWPNAGVVYGPQRAIAWRILDAQYFGVAQRRRRVFVVASARTGFDPTAILFERDGLRRDFAPSREARQDVTGTLSARTGGGGGGGGLGTDFDLAGGLQVVGTLQSSGKATGSATQQDAEAGMLIVMAHGQGNAEISVGQRPTLTCNHEAPILAFNADAQPDEMRFDPHAAAALTCSQRSAVCFAENSRGEIRLEGGDGQPVVCITGDITHCLKAEGFDASEDGTGRGQPIVAFQTKGSNIDVGDIAGTIGTNCDRASGSAPMVQYATAVRRLIPHECERLQAFPDQHTRIPLRDKAGKLTGKYAKDGPRYKALGNSMCVFVMRWLGRRIIAIDGLVSID